MRKCKSYFLSVVFLLITDFLFSQNQSDSLSLYFKNNDFKKAIKYGEKQKLISTKKDADYAILVNNLASSYSRISDYKNAELNYLEELELERSFFGENHRIIANTYRNLANVNCANKDYIKAESYYIKAIDIKKNTDGINHPEYSDYLLDLAILYKDIKDYKSAETLYIGVCDLIKRNQSENSLSYQKALISSAIFYDGKGDSVKADEQFFKSYTLQKINLKNETIPTFIFSLDIIGKRYNNKQNYYEAQKYYLESLELKKRVFGSQSQEYINSLTDLGMLYSQQSEYTKSRKYFEEVTAILKNLKREKSQDNTFVLDALATGYRYEGLYVQSEKLYYQIIDIYKNIYGENNKDYIKSLKLLAGNYLDKGDFDNAEKYYLMSVNQIADKNSYEYIKSLIEVGNFYLELNNFIKAYNCLSNADQLYTKLFADIRKDDIIHYFLRRAWQNYYVEIKDYNKALNQAVKKVEITKNNPLFGNLSDAYSKDLSDLALIYKYLGDNQNSEKFYLEAYKIRKDNIGQNPRNDATLLLSIALIYQQKKDFVSAEKYFLLSIKMVEEKLGENMPYYDDLLYYIAIFYYNNSRQSEAIPYLDKTFVKNNKDLIQATLYLSPDEFENIRKEQDGKQNFPLSFLDHFPKQYENINMGCYENELMLKNLLLRNQLRIKRNIEKSSDTLLKEKYKQFIENKRSITKLDELPIDKRPQDYQQLKTDNEVIEKDLTRQSSAFADTKKALSITWKQVQDKLEPNEVAIDIVAYNYYNKKWTDSIVYAAFVVKKEFKSPKYIPLFEQKQLTFLLARNKNQQDSISISNHYTDKAISDLFLKPLANELKGCVTVYLSPSGLGHQIDFSALPVSETQTLGEKYQVHVLGSTAELVNYQVRSLNKKDNLELLLYGGIDYNKSNSKIKINEADDEDNKYNLTDLATRSGITDFGYLGGTNIEVEQIKLKAAKNGFATKVFNEREATEESIKKLDGRTTPYVLHLATHGFFFPDPKQQLPKEQLQFSAEITKAKIYQTSDDPMMRSGLLFAGANKYWGKPTENITVDDGILTASEISNLDLSACQLVVLSACETGLGTVNGSEGVFGLQRAFKMAGVKNIIMSLWKVPDAQTAQLFDVFYEECFKGKSIHEAFQIAQSKMRDKYSPYYWAGFMLLE